MYYETNPILYMWNYFELTIQNGSVLSAKNDVIFPQIWNKTSGNNPTIQQKYLKNDIYWNDHLSERKTRDHPRRY